MAKLESKFQATLIKDLERIFPDSIIMKNDPQLTQGIPDLLILVDDRWALLEVKRSANEPARPNQPWYVDWASSRSFGAFIYPENAPEVLRALIAFFSD